MKPICKACGTQFPESPAPPASCPICCDARQFVPQSGQEWTTLEQLRQKHRNDFREYEPNLIGIGTEPEFAIGQRALFLQTPHGNFLWDCITLIDDATVEKIAGLRGTARHRDFASALLQRDARVERRIR